jgi:hypothetical protein
MYYNIPTKNDKLGKRIKIKKNFSIANGNTYLLLMAASQAAPYSS